jgi:hypothetical protein
MIAPLSFMDFADPTPQPVIMRLGWGMPILENLPQFFFQPVDWISPYLQQLHRRPYQLRQARIHALWQVGLRKEAQKVYWQGKLKRRMRP